MNAPLAFDQPLPLLPAERTSVSARSVLSAVGGTPLLELNRIGAVVAPVRVMGKAEWFNPGGSVKDRAALSMILDGERTGRLTRERILIDATSGNTGIALAMFGAALGYRVRLVVPANVGPTHRRMMRAYGAELVESSAQEGSDGAIREARRLVAENPGRYFYPDQYNNPANWKAHYEGTGAEILRQTAGAVTHLVAGLGTSGTFMGAARRLRASNPRVELIAVQPDSPYHGLEGLKHMPTALVPGIYDPALPDRIEAVATEDAQAMVLRTAREEGLLLGLSAGAALVAALRVARELRSGVVVAILPDAAFKYFERGFWEEQSMEGSHS
jgi:cysteine synthase B